MAKTPAVPTPEDIGKVIADEMDKRSLGRVQLLSERDAVKRIRLRHRTDSGTAHRWLLNAVEARTVEMLTVTASGCHMSRWKPDTRPGSGYRFILDLPLEEDDSSTGLPPEVVVDEVGGIHKGRKPPSVFGHAPDESVWVTTPARFKHVTELLIANAAARTAMHTAEKTVENSAVDFLAGPGIDRIAGLLWMAGIRSSSTLTAQTMKGEAVAHIMLRGDEIAAVAEALKRAGFPTDTHWRKFQ